MIPGPVQILIVVMIALLIFKGGRIPELMRDVGLGVSKFKKGLSDPSN